MKVLIVPVMALVLASTAEAPPPVGALNTDAFDLSAALDREVARTPTALELVIGGGYTQGVGGAGAAGDVEDMTGAGGGIELGIGARLSPGFGAGLYGTLARFQRGDAIGEGGRVHAATIGLQATWHARTARSLGPWISLGAGWRGLRLAPQDQPTSSVHGIEVVRLRLGIDYRFSSRLAITPALGASMTVFVAEGTAMTDLMSLQGNRVSLYAFTGVLGRFDLGG